MATSVKFLRKIKDARPFELGALRDSKGDILPYTTIEKVRSGRLSAHYLEADSKNDPSRLAVLFHTGDFVDITFVVVPGIYAWGGFLPATDLATLTITDRITGGFFELEAVIAGETVVLAFDPLQNTYLPVSKAVLSDAALAGFEGRKAA